MSKHFRNPNDWNEPQTNPSAVGAQEQPDPDHADDLEIEEGEDDEQGEGEGDDDQDALDEDSEETETAIPRPNRDEPSSSARNQPNSPEHELLLPGRLPNLRYFLSEAALASVTDRWHDNLRRQSHGSKG
jgi:hypothetical protein